VGGIGIPKRKRADGGINGKKWAGKRDLRSLLGTLKDCSSFRVLLFLEQKSANWVRHLASLSSGRRASIKTVSKVIPANCKGRTAKLSQYFGPVLQIVDFKHKSKKNQNYDFSTTSEKN